MLAPSLEAPYAFSPLLGVSAARVSVSPRAGEHVYAHFRASVPVCEEPLSPPTVSSVGTHQLLQLTYLFLLTLRS